MQSMNNKIPTPVKQYYLKVIQIALEGEMMSFQVAKGFGSTFYNGGRGLTIVIFAAKKDKGRKFLPLHGCFKDFWQTL